MLWSVSDQSRIGLCSLEVFPAPALQLIFRQPHPNSSMYAPRTPQKFRATTDKKINLSKIKAQKDYRENMFKEKRNNMTKDVLITIRGVHTMDEEDNDVEMIVRGDYYQKNGKHYILYEELLEGFKEPVKNIHQDHAYLNGYYQKGDSHYPHAV